jgi:hypothetical protein
VEVLKVLMAVLYEDLVIRSLEVVMPLLHTIEDGQELMILRVVVLFGT